MLMLLGTLMPSTSVLAANDTSTAPTVLFDTASFTVGAGSGFDAKRATIADDDDPSYYRLNSKAGSSGDGTRIRVYFDQANFPEGFTMLESKYMKIGYRSNIASSDKMDINPHPVDGVRIWSVMPDMTYDEQWHDLVVDLSSVKWSGGEGEVKYPAEGSSDTIFKLNFDGTMNSLTLKPYCGTNTMLASEYFDISYVAFFDSASAAQAYVYSYDIPTPNVANVTIGGSPLKNYAIVYGEDMNSREESVLPVLLENIYRKTYVLLEEVEADSRDGYRIILGGRDEKSLALSEALADDSFAISLDGTDLYIVSNAELGIAQGLKYIIDTYLGGNDLEYIANGVDIDMENTYIGNTSGYVSYNTENVNSLDEILSVPEAAEIGTMKIDGIISPLAMDDKTPLLEWYISSPERTEAQESFRITLANSLEALDAGNYVYDSGVIVSDATSFTLPESVQLEPESEYYWKVTSDLSVSGEVSRVSKFETGVMNKNLSRAEWIAPGAASDASMYNSDTTGKIEVTMKLTANAKEAGIAFGCDIDKSTYYMWQINIGDSYQSAMLRPHYCDNGSWSMFGDISLGDVFAEKTDVRENFTMRLEITEGKIETYINDTLVHTLNRNAFELGLVIKRPGYESYCTIGELESYDSKGELIYSLNTAEKTSQPIYRRDFTVNGNVKKARLYASALGFYSVEINGTRVNDSYLNPGQTSYEDKIYYQTYDVTDLIGENNAISATVAEGFYKFRQLGKYSAFIARLVVTLEDGSEYVLMTDDTWSSYEYGPVLSSSIYYGEHYDARRAVKNSSTYGACSDWSGVKTFTDTISGATVPKEIVAEEMEPVRNIISFAPIAVDRISDTTYVYDFGQNIAGTVALSASAPEGTKITLTYGEYTSGGLPVTGYMLGHNGPDSYIFAGEGEESYSPEFVYHGFRYIQIDGLDYAIDSDKIHALVLSNDMRQTSYFESSNELLNRYWLNSVWSQRGNFVSNLTDCPTREKNGWTGDAQIFVKAGSFNMDVRNIYENFMSMMKSSMSPSGGVTEILPAHNGASDGTKTPSGWSDAVVTIPYELYMQYGDTSVLTDNYDAMKKWISFLLTKNINDEEGDYVRYIGWYGDHLSYGDYTEGEGYFEEQANEWRRTKFAEVGTAYTAYSCSLIAEIAQILGNEEDVAYYTDLYEKFADAWRKNFLAEDGITSLASTQTSYVMGIYYDLYETPEKKAAAVEKLCEQIEADGGHQTVGFIGMPDLFNALSENGKTNVAYSLLLNTDTPSLLYPVTQGATTTWEAYAGGSHNHYVQASPVKWVFTDVLGIDHRRDHANAGYKNFTLEPKIGYGLTDAKASYESANGIIRSAWSLTSDGYTYTCTVPANTSAQLKLPKSSSLSQILESGKSLTSATGISNVASTGTDFTMTLASGTYTFTVNDGEIRYGDVDDSGTVDATDTIQLARSLANWGVTINERAADVNVNGTVEPADNIILQRHVARWNDYLSLPYTC